MNDDNLYQYYCQSCGQVIHSHRYDGGYGDHSYDHKTIKPYEEKRFNLPEQKQSMTLEICLDCINKDPTCHNVVKKKRIEWFDKEIEGKIKQISNTEKEIESRMVSIPNMKEEVLQLKKKKHEVENEK